MTKEAHLEIGSYAAMKKVDFLYTIGDDAMMISKAALDQGMSPGNVIHFEHKGYLYQAINNLPKGSTILVKGSRKSRMEDVVNYLVARYGEV